VLVAESAGLAAVLNHLLDPADRLSRLGSPRELDESRSLDSADVVVLDVPLDERAAAVGQIRRRYLGPLVILVTKGESARALHLDDACALLTRPFSADDLSSALAVPGRPVAGPAADVGPRVPPFIPARTGPVGVALVAAPGADTAAGSPDPAAAAAAADLKASARQAPFRPPPAAPPGPAGPLERARWLLATFTQSWQARRRVRVAGFSVFALVAFTAAFALAAQGGHCGPGCDAFGTVFSPDPTVAPASSRAVTTTGPKRTTTTAAPSGVPGTGAYRGISGGRAAATTTTAAERVTTTSKKPATTRPATTRPATTRPVTTTTAPPTTTTLPSPPTTAGA
jgi:hypothetical protein